MENQNNVALQLAARKYDPNKAAPAEQVILTIDGKKVGSLQNFITISGKQKNGKSRFIGATISTAISGNELFKIRLRQPQGRNRIALFDTEQSDYDFYKQMQQIKQFSGIDHLPDTFDAFNTREDDPGKQMQMIEYYLKHNPDCAIFFLDGLLDLVISYNDDTEGKRLVNWLKRLTKQQQLLMILVLHRGKNSDLTIGHVGSMVDRACQSTLKVEKNKERNTFCMSSDFMRSDADFAPVEIYFDTHLHQWIETDHIPEEQPTGNLRSLKPKPYELDIQEHIRRLGQIFNSQPVQSYKIIVQNIMEVYGVGRNVAVDTVKFLRDENLLYKNDEGYTISKQSKLKLV